MNLRKLAKRDDTKIEKTKILKKDSKIKINK